MMTPAEQKAGEYFAELQRLLGKYYDEQEARSIALLALEKVAGLSGLDLIKEPERLLDCSHIENLDRVRRALLKGVPFQYAVGNTVFLDHEIRVNRDVLIPRPETEELVSWIIEDLGEDWKGSILDIGTGSGCIAIALSAALPFAVTKGIDRFEGSIKLALENASTNGVEVEFSLVDILDRKSREQLGTFDLIVSNPPYVTVSEQQSMKPHVIEHEPHDALFVPDSDPLLFYRGILDFARSHLNPSGLVYFEINERMALPLRQLLDGYAIGGFALRKDIHQKNRFLKVVFKD
jgi:release factor glutamine methyltransferase